MLLFFASSTYILRKLFFHYCLNLEAMLRNGELPQGFCPVFSAMTEAECIARERW